MPLPALDPKALPAPVGRGPFGWPLKRCECSGCRDTIAWPPGLSVKAYVARRFCSYKCAGRAGGRKALSGSGSGLGLFRQRLLRPAAERKTDIRECPHCRAGPPMLQEIAPGVRCLGCGKIAYTLDGEFAHERGAGAMT